MNYYLYPRSGDSDIAPEHWTKKVYDKIIWGIHTIPKPYWVAGVIVFMLIATSLASHANGWRLVPLPSGCDTVTLKSGQTMSQIARETGVPLGDLATLNPQIPNLDEVYAGEPICVSLPESVDVAPATEGKVFTGSDESGKHRHTFDTTFSSFNHDAGGPQPGALVLANHLADRYVYFGRAIDSDFGIGVYNGRLARGSSSWSTHASGRAVDVYITDCEDDRAFEMFAEMVGLHQRLGIQRLVMCDLEWRSDRGWGTASDTLAAWHDGRRAPAHLHLELSWDAATNLTNESVSAAFSALDSQAPLNTPESTA